MITLVPSVAVEGLAEQRTAGDEESSGATIIVAIDEPALPLVSTTLQVTATFPDAPWVVSVADWPWLASEPAVAL
jgi:hypothetical protein